MRQLQFFVFALFLIWFANTGKLRALWTALRGAPATPSASGDAPSGTSGDKPAVTGVGSLPSAPSGNILDPNNPRNIITGDPFGFNR